MIILLVVAIVVRLDVTFCGHNKLANIIAAVEGSTVPFHLSASHAGSTLHSETMRHGAARETSLVTFQTNNNNNFCTSSFLQRASSSLARPIHVRLVGWVGSRASVKVTAISNLVGGILKSLVNQRSVALWSVPRQNREDQKLCNPLTVIHRLLGRGSLSFPVSPRTHDVEKKRTSSTGASERFWTRGTGAFLKFAPPLSLVGAPVY